MCGCVIQSKISQPDSLGRLGPPGEPMAAKETAELEVFGEQGGSWVGVSCSVSPCPGAAIPVSFKSSG